MEDVVCECYQGDSSEKKKKQNSTTTPVTVVLKVDFHCDGCIARIVRLSRRLEGVETVRADPVSNKLTLIGFIMDPVKVAEKLQKKSKKKVELISPKPNKDTKEKNEKKANDKTQNVVAVTTVVLKLNCSCDGCIKRICKTVSKTKGVYQVKMDREKETVTVMGAMDIKSVTENLKRKLKKTVQIVPEKKKKKEKDNAEGITKVGSPGQPGYGCNHGLGPYRFMEGPMNGFFSEEDQSFCSIIMTRQRMITVDSPKKKVGGIVKLKNVVERLVQIKGFSSAKKPCSEEYDRDCVPKDVKEGHFAVIAVDGYHEPTQRFVVPLMFLEHPMFRKLLEQAEEEYGFYHDGALMVPCRPSHLRMILTEEWC
ncbi:Heavy metal-associated domain HMA [Arabidopsis thaliana x Arabidopsis arenosa]|uniref:Heavy metal-associated domain HMA n=1 Tax=Arabidopsis thaliana x Arabidopsis arenosa TaxID=1240361 RepID=A0A8T2A9D0_9BRAS|nr:Heavy metal-associated domain HMA [Arabidopsis thaliana x Arabidopsis arenosa]